MTDDSARRHMSLAGLVGRHAQAEGATPHRWPGLTFYRFSAPVPHHWDETGALAYCLVVQGAMRVRAGAGERVHGPLDYLVFSQRSRAGVEIAEASPARPFLSFLLQLGTPVVNEVLATVHQAAAGSPPSPGPAPLAGHLAAASCRFLASLDSGADAAVLAPMYVRELVYRLLQSPERPRLIAACRASARRDPVAAAIGYMKNHLHDEITVTGIAEAACMSESAFAHLFKQAVGTSPYQFLKQLRLEHARDHLLQHGCGVREAASDIGYTSLSHFISEFKRYFGDTPRTYLLRLQGVETLNLHGR